MKVVVVLSEFPKITETFAYRNITEYRRLGVEARVFHLKPRRRGEVVHGFMRDIVESAFTFGFLSRPALGALMREATGAPRRLWRLLREVAAAHWREPLRGLTVLAYLPKALALGEACRRDGVAHINAEFAGHPATAAMVAARAAGLPFSFSAHAHDIFVSQALLTEKARSAAFVRAISGYNMEFLQALKGFPADKLRLIRCGVPQALLSAPGPTPPGDGPLRVLYVGALLPRKGVNHLLDALAAASPDLDWRARVIGGGRLAGPLAAHAQALGLGERVHFEGPRPAEAVFDAYREAHVVVIPSVIGKGGRMEGIPVVAMEAMSHGLPVVASSLSGIPELIEDGVTGRLVPPGDPAAIAAALQAIAADWPAAASMGARARDRIAAEYVVEDNARALCEHILRSG